ncbi:hypothetical protein MHL86_24205 [Brevibacillus laterosporus]|nr:hypothetical protein [Brevibacillus laterosporus]
MQRVSTYVLPCLYILTVKGDATIKGAVVNSTTKVVVAADRYQHVGAV